MPRSPTASLASLLAGSCSGTQHSGDEVHAPLDRQHEELAVADPRTGDGA
jgi:hypothetical protein